MLAILVLRKRNTVSLSISSNLQNQSLLQLSSHQSSLQKSFQQLSSGSAIDSAADNPSGLAIFQSLEAQVGGTDQGTSNVTDALNALNTAEGANSSQADALQQLNVLSIQASNDFLSTSDRANLQTEANQITQQMNTTASQTNFNGQPLEQGQSYAVQAGATEGNTVTAQTTNTNSATLGVSSIDLSSTSSAETAIGSSQAGIDNLSTQRAQLGAQEVSLGEQIDNNNTYSNNLQASASNIADANIGQASTNAGSSELQSAISLSVLKSSNNQLGFLTTGLAHSA
jgi:flagellin